MQWTTGIFRSFGTRKKWLRQVNGAVYTGEDRCNRTRQFHLRMIKKILNKQIDERKAQAIFGSTSLWYRLNEDSNRSLITYTNMQRERDRERRWLLIWPFVKILQSKRLSLYTFFFTLKQFQLFFQVCKTDKSFVGTIICLSCFFQPRHFKSNKINFCLKPPFHFFYKIITWWNCL